MTDDERSTPGGPHPVRGRRRPSRPSGSAGSALVHHRLPKVRGHGGHDIQTVLIGVGAPESAVGYTRSHWTQLRDDLVRLARRGEVVAEQQTPFGIKYVVDGVIRVPVGRSVALRTIWISDGPDDPPRLVTAYPR